MEVVDLLFRFWILKRRSLANRPLFIPRADDPEATASTAPTSASEDNQREKLKRFVALRQVQLKMTQMYRPGQPNWEYTMWKFQDFSAYQILHEIDIGQCHWKPQKLTF